MTLPGCEDWLFKQLYLKTTSEYRDTPLAWAGGTTTVKWVGSDAGRANMLTKGMATFSDIEWGREDGVWTEEVKNDYRAILKTFYSMPALRLMEAVNDIVGETDPPDGEKSRIIDRCTEAQVPLCAPKYLAAFAQQVRRVTAGEEEGGHFFTQVDVLGDTTANPLGAGVQDPASDSKEENLALRDANARLTHELQAARMASTVTAPQTSAQVQTMVTIALAAYTHQQQANAVPGALTLMQKPKWH